MQVFGYTYELQPNGSIIKSATRYGFLILVFLAVFICVASIAMFEYNFIMLYNFMKETCNPDGTRVMSVAEFRATIGALTFIPITAVSLILTVAFTGKTGQKYLEGINLSSDTPKQDLNQNT